MLQHRVSFRLATAIGAITLGCTNDPGERGSPTEPAFSILVTPLTLAVPLGTSGAAQVSIGRIMYAGPVDLSAVPPDKVTVVFTPASTNGSLATMSVSVGSLAMGGSFPITVTGTGTGLAQNTQTSQFTLLISAAARYSLTATPVGVTIRRGASATTTISIARTQGFTGDVVLGLVPDSLGLVLTGNFDPVDVTGESSVLTLNAAPTLAPGVYSVRIHGLVQGALDVIIAIQVTVTS